MCKKKKKDKVYNLCHFAKQHRINGLMNARLFNDLGSFPTTVKTIILNYLYTAYLTTLLIFNLLISLTNYNLNYLSFSRIEIIMNIPFVLLIRFLVNVRLYHNSGESPSLQGISVIFYYQILRRLRGIDR